MMGEILRIVSEGRVSSVEGIAEKIKMPPEITRVMLDDLVRRRLLREIHIPLGAAGQKKCSGCGECSCSGTNEVKAWELTTGGKNEIA